MRFAELFAGAGGLSLGLEQAGHECVWHCEIAPHARAVLRHHWPDVPLLGDVASLDGRNLVAQYGPVDLLSGGSPCQDLSLAGRRAGFRGARSGLFHQQLRLWQETGADLMLWENVMGALSSHDGTDFQIVLEELSGTDLIRPDAGWPTAGVVRSADGCARVAYRCLDLQWFGPPQRRRRVFVLAVAPHALDRYDPAAILLTDAVGRHLGGQYPAQVLRLGQGEPWLPEAGTQGRQATAAHAPEGPDAESGESYIPEVCGTLSDGAHHGGGLNGQDVYSGRIIAPDGVPRRFTLTECERLMGWPDGWTATGDRETGTTYHLPDSARYRLVSNGVGSPCTKWIGESLTLHERQP